MKPVLSTRFELVPPFDIIDIAIWVFDRCNVLSRRLTPRVQENDRHPGASDRKVVGELKKDIPINGNNDLGAITGHVRASGRVGVES